jgi:hypothetical protein
VDTPQDISCWPCSLDCTNHIFFNKYQSYLMWCSKKKRAGSYVLERTWQKLMGTTQRKKTEGQRSKEKTGCGPAQTHGERRERKNRTWTERKKMNVDRHKPMWNVGTEKNWTWTGLCVRGRRDGSTECPGWLQYGILGLTKVNHRLFY